MAITGNDRGTGGNNSGATSITITPASNLTAGSKAILVLAYDNQGTNGADPFSSISDSHGNTWATDSPALYDPAGAGAGVALRIFSSSMSAGTLTTGSTITVSFGAISVTAKAWTLSELVPTAGFAISFSAAGASTGSTSGTPTVTSSSLTSGTAIIGAGGAESADTWAGDADSSNGSWSTKQSTAFGTGNNGMSVISQRKIVTGTATQTFNPTLTSADCILCWASYTEASIGYTITAAGGSYALSGTAATLKRALKLSADSGSFALTGTAATLKRNITLTAGAGSFALTGTAATLKRALKLSADVGSYSLTGAAATLKAGKVMGAAVGSYAQTGTAASLKSGRLLSAASGSYALTGTAATLQYSALNAYTLTAGSGSFALTGTAASLKAGRKLAAGAGSYALTGTAASFVKTWKLTASGGSYTLSGTAATLIGPSVSFAIGINFRDSSGYAADAADETYCLGEGDTYPTTRGGVTFGWETIAEGDIGRDRDNSLDRRLAGFNGKTNSGSQNIFRLDLPSSGSYAIRLALGEPDFDQAYQYLQIQDGTAPVLTIDDTNGTFAGFWDDATGAPLSASNWPTSNTAVTGVAFSTSILRLVLGSPTAQANTTTLAHLYIEAEGAAATLVPDSGVYSVTGQAATFKRALKLSAASGSFAQTGTAATLKQGRKLSAASGSYSQTGQSATLTYSPLGSYTLSAGVGSYSLTGTAASLKRALRLSADSGSLALTGSDASLKRGSKLSAGTGTFALTGTAASLLRGRQLVAGTGTFVVTGTSTSFPRTRRMVTLSGLYNLTGTDVELDRTGLAGVSPRIVRSRLRSFGAQPRNRTFNIHPRDRSFEEQPRPRTFTGRAKLRTFEE